jgi:hypothetical protein
MKTKHLTFDYAFQDSFISLMPSSSRAAFYEGIGLDTGVGGIWTGQRHRTTDICEE